MSRLQNKSYYYDFIIIKCVLNEYAKVNSKSTLQLLLLVRGGKRNRKENLLVLIEYIVKYVGMWSRAGIYDF